MLDDSLRKIGRYEILERVGRGGMGVLYRGRDTVLDREVAIKVMSGDFAEDETAHSRFFREAKAAARLQHRNVVTVFEFAEHDETPYIVMEFLRGRSLATRLKDGTPLKLPETLDIVIQLCAGLEFAHREGVIHRDVKPGNIWLCEDGTAKLLDFGIAKSAASTVTKAGDVMGSPSYMSPEQIGGRELDGRSDVFSAGVVLYELLSGRKPFEADSPTAVMMKIVQETARPLQELAPDVPPALAAATSHALEKDPDARYARAADFAADLQLVRLALEDGAGLDQSVLLAETMYAEDLRRQTGPSIAGATSLLTPPGGRRGIRGAEPVAPPALWRRPAVLGVAALVVLIVAALGTAMWWQKPPAIDDTSEPTAAPSALPAKEATLPPPAPVTPLTAEHPRALEITSDPPGAAIIVDGRDTHKVTPAEIPLEGSKRPRRVRLTKRSFEPRDVIVSDDVLQQGKLTVTLDPANTSPVTVDVAPASEGSYPFEVLDGSRVISAAATSHHLTVSGRRSLRLRAPEYFLDQSVTVDPASGRQAHFQAPGLGRLTVRTPLETCTVMIAGRSLGFPPIVNVPIAAGKYTVQLKCQSEPNRQAAVTISARQDSVEIIR
ncbi:MAG: hypothetical protein A3H96_16010 [Acidobacteria bacterium RIFCSPLOWO2_02_FULL_67_36]|nr:MAG: hypothetical protein A3H96_16010 [Acidobacteria bacterium RIFCSPLOWO2_02_FULL_67_36]OFW21223.1 MAG: hypothetical protein A3G21_11225 [Acidobacteria bacterium RIFCSPLOWO2_12_FULL_66_21]